MSDSIEELSLIKIAQEVCEKAYAPYSGFKVGAALLATSGQVYTGCNVENVSFGGTICAERAAVCAAVAAGEREYKAIAIAVATGNEDIVPCGICRQVLSEFSKDGSLLIICAQKNGYKTYRLSDLLPYAFKEF